MEQVVQNISSGKTGVRTIPDPVALPGAVVIRNRVSVISPGTERSLIELARKGLLGKALDRPDHVRRVLQKVREEGLLPALRQVFAKLEEPFPLGYSCAGVVLECGKGVTEFKPGDRLASAGPHAGVVSVGRNLCARIPEGVSFEQAAYTSVGAIALEAIRLARVSLGDRVLVIGLGLIGQITVGLLKAQGCRVFATDPDPRRLEMAAAFGADQLSSASPVEAVRAFTDSAGVDAALITAATQSSEPVEFAAEACRKKARIVLVGVVGLELPRDPFFKKELEFTVSSSLGPGRGDPLYEEKGIDYPIGHARWTAARNMQAVLETMAAGKLPVERLTTHRFPIAQAEAAYELITRGSEHHVGVVLDYPTDPENPKRCIEIRSGGSPAGKLGLSVIGAGQYARLVLLPLLARHKGVAFRGLCSAKGLSAEDIARRTGFAFATTDFEEILRDPGTRAVFIATRHDAHAELVLSALRAGKHVFVEKPLCIDPRDLARLRGCLEELGEKSPILTVGFNRRFAPATAELQAFFRGVSPLSVSYRFAPGPLGREHWTQDEDVGGGRIVGEACHAVDTCVALTQSPPVKIYAESLGKTDGAETTDDRVFITMRHQNGSVSGISYQAGGDRACPAEQIEVFGGGRTAIVEAWDRIELWRDNRRVRRRGGRDRGHAAEFKVFLDACRSGGAWPIPWAHLESVSLATFLAVRSLREGVPFDL